jgi:adenine-specific DNA methylase
MRKKMIEVAIPLDAINRESAREKEPHMVGTSAFGGLQGSVVCILGR